MSRADPPPAVQPLTRRMPKKKKKPSEMPVIGWREWVALPELGIKYIKAKVDSGARSSSLHAFDIRKFSRNGVDWVRFEVHPVQRSKRNTVKVEYPVLEYRKIRSSSGRASRRPVIVTEVSLLGKTWPIELTLAGRDQMGFRMLLGRQAFRGRFLVDASRSYLGGKPDKKKKPN